MRPRQRSGSIVALRQDEGSPVRRGRSLVQARQKKQKPGFSGKPGFAKSHLFSQPLQRGGNTVLANPLAFESALNRRCRTRHTPNGTTILFE